MSKHTKGPWQFVKYDWRQEGKNFQGAVVANKFSIVSAGMFGVSGKNPKESEANARLISAAPTMYKALKKLACLGNGNTYGNSDGNIIAQQAIEGVDAEGAPNPKKEE